MRKLSPDRSIPSLPSPCSFVVSIHLYIYIYVCIYIHGGRQSTKTDGGTSGHCRSRSGDSKQALYEAQCVTPLLRFLFAPQSYTCFPSIHVPSFLPFLLPSFLGCRWFCRRDKTDPFLITPLPHPPTGQIIWWNGTEQSLMERVHLALLALRRVVIRVEWYLG